MDQESGKRPTRTPSLRGRFIKCVLSAFFAVAAMEILLRTIDLPVVEPAYFVSGNDANRAFEFDFETMWRFPRNPEEKWGPAAVDEVSNRFGCRGYEPSLKKAENDLRVICVGSSGVGGYGLPLGWSFPIVLERQLQARYPGARVETVLGGVAGYTSEQQRALLLGRLATFKPDLVVFLTGTHNDLAPARDRDDEENLRRLRPGSFKTLDLLRYRSRFVNDLAYTSGRSSTSPEQSAGDDVTKVRVSLPRFRRNLRVMFDHVKKVGAQSLVVLPSTTDHSAERVIYRDAVEVEALTAGVPIIDLKAVASRPADWLDSLHLSRGGHANLSAALFRRIEADHLLVAKAERLGGKKPTFEIVNVDPREITVGGSRTITLTVNGLNESELSRVWCTGMLATFRWLDPRTLLVTVPRVLPIRESELELVTSKGSRRFPGAFLVKAPKLDVHLLPSSNAADVALLMDLPAATKIKFVVSIDPVEKPINAFIGPLWFSVGESWPPRGEKITAFLKRKVFTEAQSYKKGKAGATWTGASTLKPGTRLAIQGLMAVPYPGHFEPVAVTTPYFLTIPD